MGQGSSAFNKTALYCCTNQPLQANLILNCYRQTITKNLKKKKKPTKNPTNLVCRPSFPSKLAEHCNHKGIGCLSEAVFELYHWV